MDTWAILVAFVVLFCSIYYWLTRGNYFEKRGIIHMKPLPLVGNSAPIILRTETFAGYTEKLYNFHKEAKYIGVYDFNEPTIFIRDPELIKSITVKNFDHFVDHRGFVDPDQEPIFGKNLFALKGNKWREVRNLLSPAFTSRKMRAMFKLMSDCAENFADYLINEAKKQELEVNSKDIFTRYTNDVIATCAFGVAVDSMRNPKNEFYTLCRKATTFDSFALIRFVLMRQFPKFTKFFKIRIMSQKVETFFKELVRNTVETRDREGITRPDMIQLMMESRSKKSGEGPNLTIHDMTAQAFIFFLAGFETTATLMCFLSHLISIHPKVQKKIQDEIDGVREQYQENVTYEAINDMQYLEAVIYETLRLYPVQPAIDRVCTQTFELPPALPGKKPVVLKPGDCVGLPIYAFHRDSNYFANPNDFYPERFIEDPQGTLHNSTFFPFGAGPRMCIGNRFALLETKVLIFHLMTKCSLKPGKKMILPLELDPKMPSMNAKGEFWLTLTPRNDWKQKEIDP